MAVVVVVGVVILANVDLRISLYLYWPDVEEVQKKISPIIDLNDTHPEYET
jgi:hypothetical protein